MVCLGCKRNRDFVRIWLGSPLVVLFEDAGHECGGVFVGRVQLSKESHISGYVNCPFELPRLITKEIQFVARRIYIRATYSWEYKTLRLFDIPDVQRHSRRDTAAAAGGKQDIGGTVLKVWRVAEA
ncbi:hypothetical protein B0H14DRAFT_2565209 [Mycena olivaceomarginata]|nr:hypothetical protein B0H14DRAFT_2565209 [Mycena olivaceomarginata]